MPWTYLGVFSILNLFFAVVIGLYFWNLLRQQQRSKSAVDKESRKEMEKLQKLKSSPHASPCPKRPGPGVRRDRRAKRWPEGAPGRPLRSHPQHVIIYGPPGVGKTAAARLVLEEAKRNPLAVSENARFVEVDATIARFDDRGIADPLLGSVHDPIYQGAGPLGMAGIPQPKPGAVTKAHGGVLFIDEIGELHPIQMNKLLKVLEDRKVFLESAYYSSEDTPNPGPHSRNLSKRPPSRLPPGGRHDPDAPRDPAGHPFPLSGDLFPPAQARRDPPHRGERR